MQTKTFKEFRKLLDDLVKKTRINPDALQNEEIREMITEITEHIFLQEELEYKIKENRKTIRAIIKIPHTLDTVTGYFYYLENDIVEQLTQRDQNTLYDFPPKLWIGKSFFTSSNGDAKEILLHTEAMILYYKCSCGVVKNVLRMLDIKIRRLSVLSDNNLIRLATISARIENENNHFQNSTLNDIRRGRLKERIGELALQFNLVTRETVPARILRQMYTILINEGLTKAKGHEGIRKELARMDYCRYREGQN